jgi:hypothetical protein
MRVRTIVYLKALHFFLFLVSIFNKLKLLGLRENYPCRYNFNASAVAISLQTCMEYRLAKSGSNIKES